MMLRYCCIIGEKGFFPGFTLCESMGVCFSAEGR